MSKRILFALVALCVLLPQTLPAFNIGNVNLYAVNEFIYQYNQLANRENQFYETFSLFANVKQWSLGITMRGNNFFQQTPNRTLGSFESDVYRKFIQYNGKNLKVNLGDFYSLLGRGLVLAVLKNDEVLRERTISGANLHYNRGGLDLRVLAGEMRDETSNQEWRVAGGEAAFRYGGSNRVGVHFSFIDDVATWKNLGKRLTYSLSFSGHKILKNLSYYAEFAGLSFQDNQQDPGKAVYANVTYNKARVTGFVEYKLYKDFNNELNNPPVADRLDEVSPLNDTEGLRAYLQYAFFDPDISFFVNFGRYREYEDRGNHVYAGFNVEDLLEKFSFSLSYGVKDVLYRIKRLDGHFLVQLTDRLSADLTFKDKRYRDGTFTFTEADQNLQISFAPALTIFVMHQYSHNKIIDLNHFYSGGIRVNLKGGSVIELSGGTIRGGLLCSAGQCFTAPPFKGVKFSFFHIFK